MTEVPLTPAAIESRLRRLVTELSQAQQTLAQARDMENEARWDLNRARRRAVLSGNAPRVARDGATAAERDAWVEDKIDGEQVAYDRAVVAREAAQDHLRVVRDQASVVQSLGVSVRLAYELAGHSD